MYLNKLASYSTGKNENKNKIIWNKTNEISSRTIIRPYKPLWVPRLMYNAAFYEFA